MEWGAALADRTGGHEGTGVAGFHFGAAVQQRVLSEARAGGERWAVAMMLFLGSVVQFWTGRIEGAVDAATEGLEMFRAVHDRFGQVRIVWSLARGLTMLGAVAEEVDTGAENAALQAALALVRAAEGRVADAATLAASVLGSAHASYLDRALAGIASGLAAARVDDAKASVEGFEAAETAVAASGDRLTKLLVRLARTRVRAVLDSGAQAGRDVDLEDVQRRLVEMGTDAAGWVTLFDLAVGREVR